MLVERKLVYSGRIVDLIVDKIEVNGREAIREVVKHPGGVVILVESEDGRIPFVKQIRYPLGKPLLELPAGKLDPGEEPSQCAARELEEETGIRPAHLNHVYSFYPSPGFCTELLHLYHTDRFERTASNFDQDEQIEVEYHSLEDALEMCRKGEILDGKTILALHWLQSKRHQR